jgi:hypothetical protein
MKKDFVIRGQTASGETEILEFGGYKEGYGYKMIQFEIYPSTNIQGHLAQVELAATVTAAKTAEDPSNPNFNNEGLIATAMYTTGSGGNYKSEYRTIVNDTFIITQNLILSAIDTEAGSPTPVNWQCRFESIKLSDSQAAATNFKQFSIFDE